MASSIEDIQWESNASDKVVVANANPTLLYQPSLLWSGNPLARPMTSNNKVAITRKLLDGAIASAKSTVLSSNKPPAKSSLYWIWQLAGLYHLTHFSPPLLEEAAQRFASAGLLNLAHWAARKASEERNHDQLALLDIQSLGYSSEKVVEALFPPISAALVNYFARSVQTPDPISCVGYCYTMERLAMCIGEKYIQAVEALLPSGIQATRCLRVHSSVGSDVEHVEETVEIVAELVPEERIRVATACYETAMLYFSSPKESYMSEEELENILESLKSPTYAYK